MGSGSYSFAAYSCLANEREYSTKSADAVFKNRSLSAKSDIKLSNINARTYNTQIKPEMVDTGVRESRDSNEHPETTPIIIALDVTGSMRRTPHEMIKDNFPKLMDAQKQANLAVITSKTKSLEAIQRTVQITEEGRAAAERAKWEQEKEKAVAVTKAQQEFEVAELEAKKAKQVALKVQAEGEAKAAANRALVSAGLTPAERAEWDYKTAVGVAQALAESKVSWVPSVMFGGNGSSNSAMDAVGLKMLLDITKSFDKTSK